MSGNREKYVKLKSSRQNSHKDHVMGSRSDDTKYHRVFSKSRKSEKSKNKSPLVLGMLFSKRNRLPVCFGILSLILVIVGVIIIGSSSDTTTAAAPQPKPEQAIDFQTFTYEDGLVTMGLKTAAEVSQETANRSKILIPPKAKTYDPIIYSYPAAGKRVSLTFDDGPSPKMTEDYLNVLDELNIKASFFMLANSVMAYPDLTKEVEDRGHDVVSHSKEHANLANLSSDQLEADFSYSNDAFKEVLGHTPKMMRPPYGSYTDEVLSVAKKYGQQPIYWSIDTNDWRKYSTETMVNTILNNLSDGAVILMHEGKSNTLDALPAIAEAVRAAGYEFVPLSELLSY